MKKIKIKICGFDKNNEWAAGHFIIKTLEKYYKVELSENPEYLFYDESTYEHLKYDCIKIFYTGENAYPNFNFCDYAWGFDYMTFGDRYYRLPLYLIAIFYSQKEIELAGDTDFTKPYFFTKQDLAKKTEFCSFVYSNYLADEIRKIFFDKLSKYKKVNSGGKYLNNIGGPTDNKLEFEMKHKFSIAFENTSSVGYTTEKIVNSLAAKTIPIYWGNPEIHKEFNEERFINCYRYRNFDEVVERVKEIDRNDDLYLSIINKPVTVESYNFKKVRHGFEEFLQHIIDQPLALARRRKVNNPRVMTLEKYEMIISKHAERRSKIRKIIAMLYQPIKKLGILENMKERYFRKKTFKK